MSPDTVSPSSLSVYIPVGQDELRTQCHIVNNFCYCHNDNTKIIDHQREQKKKLKTERTKTITEHRQLETMEKCLKMALERRNGGMYVCRPNVCM